MGCTGGKSVKELKAAEVSEQQKVQAGGDAAKTLLTTAAVKKAVEAHQARVDEAVSEKQEGESSTEAEVPKPEEQQPNEDVAAGAGAFEAALQEECDKRIAAYSGTLWIATFEYLVHYVERRSLVFATLAAAQAHGETAGARGPFNLIAREVSVTAGKCDTLKDTDLVVEYLRKEIRPVIEQEMACAAPEEALVEENACAATTCTC